MQVVKALVADLRGRKKTRVDHIYYGGGGNNGSECNKLVQGYLKTWAEQGFIPEVEGLEEIKI